MECCWVMPYPIPRNENLDLHLVRHMHPVWVTVGAGVLARHLIRHPSPVGGDVAITSFVVQMQAVAVGSYAPAPFALNPILAQNNVVHFALPLGIVAVLGSFVVCVDRLVE